MQAISATTGIEAAGFPVEIEGNSDKTPGVAFAAFSSDCDSTPYRGIVIGVSTSTHQISAMWSDEAGTGTDQDSQSGIWQSGGGLVSDGPNQILLTTGNGIAPPASKGTSTPPTLSESVVRL